MNPNCPHYRLLNVMLPKTVLMMFSGAIWWRRVFMCPKTWIWAAAKSNCEELWIPGANREFVTAFVLIIISVFYAAIFAAGVFKNSTNHDSSEQWIMNVAATYWHLYFSLCPPYNLRKKLQLFTFSPRPFVRLGKVCQVWIRLHYCFLWLFRQWKVSKEPVYSRIVFSHFHCLTKLVGSPYSYTLI